MPIGAFAEFRPTGGTRSSSPVEPSTSALPLRGHWREPGRVMIADLNGEKARGLVHGGSPPCLGAGIVQPSDVASSEMKVTLAFRP
jgi:hypothetical protein